MSPSTIILAVLLVLSSTSPLAAASSSDEPRSAYEVIEDFNFPQGILPKGVTGYELDRSTGQWKAFFNGSCSFSLEGSYQLKYKSTITGVISNNRLTSLTGVSVKVLFLWLNIVEVSRSGDDLDFSVGFASASFPIDNFYECPQCGCGLNCGTGPAHHHQQQMRDMADWANLPEDVLISIVKRAVTGLEEFVVFGFVCKGWRSVMTEETFGRLKKEIPWIMPSTFETTDIGTIYNPTKEQLYRFNLPEANTKSCYSSQGWLMTISHSDLEVELLNPLRPYQIKKLGSLKKFDNFRIKKFALSSSPSSSSDYRVMVLCTDKLIAFHRGRWTLVQGRNNNSEVDEPEFQDITYYEGQFYAVASYDCNHCIVNVYVVIEDSEEPGSHKRKRSKEPKMREVLKYGPNNIDSFDKCYLVESAGDLLVVLQMSYISGFRIFKVSIPSNRTRSNGPRKSKVKDLGSRSLFLGSNSSSFSVEASDYYACKPNCIYFTFEIHDKLFMCIFHMGDEKIEPCRKVVDFGRSDLWIQPRPCKLQQICGSSD